MKIQIRATTTSAVVRTVAPRYHRVYYAMRRAHERGDQAKFRLLRQQQRTLPSADPNDPRYRRLRYQR
ncbi:hypothetical protein [Phytohabitans suffuscus]|uniref:hypothetical protein n=1 Tax=Phytohabitans suffuscus TaxID=624315 RepID=UPI001567AF03|nr:hypothetical protein [Phytohabitans suffuscus]